MRTLEKLKQKLTKSQLPMFELLGWSLGTIANIYSLIVDIQL